MPSYLINFNLKNLPKYYTDFLIIGSGCAGLTSAIFASEYSNVLVLTKNKIDEATTKYAQGGIASPLGEDDSEELHIKDTLRVGCGLCNKDAVEILVKESKDRVNELIHWGVKFDKEGDRLHLSREGAHSKNRIIHSKGYQTGEEVEKILIKEVEKRPNINIKENIFVIDLLTYNNCCFGCIALNKNNNKIEAYISKIIILATGGAAQLYKFNTNPNVSTGDGIAAAYRAGCFLSDLEFLQFHPTTIIRNNEIFLITEAVRGEGGILRDDRGTRFMVKKHQLGELAPRDILSRCIFEKIRNNEKVYLDLTHINPTECRRRFQNIYKTCKQYNLDIRYDLIPVTPAAHYIIGGILTDINAKTNIDRLFAIGECACTYVHGANRLGSNSILEGLVFSKRCVNYCVNNILKEPLIEYQIEYNKIKNKNKKIDIDKFKKKIKNIMWDNVGIIRSEKTLKEALSQLKKIRWVLNYQFTHQAEFELQNMLQVAFLITKGALIRCESRGTHYREDYKKIDNKNWKKHIIWYMKNNKDYYEIK